MQPYAPSPPPSRVDPSTSEKKGRQAATRQLRLLDYRNGKYQGITSNDTMARNGLGILIDDNYSFVLSDWKDDHIQGPFFMVYPDEAIMYGFIQKQNIGEFVCYEVNNEFVMILSKNTNVLLVDLLPSNSILVFKVDKKFLDEHTLSTILKHKHQNEANREINEGIQLLSQEEYANPQEKYKIYQKKLSISSIPQFLKTYESFIKEKFNSSPQRIELIEILKTRQDLTLSFKNSTITLFLKLYLQNNQTKMLGSMNKYENSYEFYRKIMHTSNSVEQFVSKTKAPFTAQYNLRPNIRPKQCSVELCNFHRAAVTYSDHFVNLSYMYKIKQNLQKVNELINIFVMNKLAQVQLQTSRYDPKGGQQVQKKSGLVQYTLEEVQQEIYDAVKRKRLNTGRKDLTRMNPSRSISEFPTYTNKSTQNYTRSQVKNIDTSRNNNTPYMKALHGSDQITESRLNRSKSYMNMSNISKNQDYRATPTKNTPNKSINQYSGSSKKYHYLDEDQKLQVSKPLHTPLKYEPYMNMKRLTEDYQDIQREMGMNTPKQSKSPYRLDNSVYRKNTLRSYQLDNYGQSTNVKHAPLSQKKVFKYLPN